MKRRINNIYTMNGFGAIKGVEMVNSKKAFRTFKKGGFYTTKNDFKVKTLLRNNDYILKVDGSCFEPNTFNKNLFKRLGKLYPMY